MSRDFLIRRALVLAFVATGCFPFGPESAGGSGELVVVNGTPRHFWLFVPEDGGSTSPRPLLLVFHGLGGSSVEIQSGTGFNGVARHLGFIVAYPDADPSTNGQWALGCARCTAADSLGIDDMAFVDRIIDYVDARHGVDRQRIYATGFSLGGYMAHMLACLRPATFAAVAPVGGHMTNMMASACPQPPSGAVPLLQVTGLLDPVMPWVGVVNPTHTIYSADASASFWATRNGCPGTPTDTLIDTPVPYEPIRVRRYNGCGGEVQRWGIPSLAHTWPASGAYGSLGIGRFLLRFSR